MDMTLKQTVSEKFASYFPEVELPIACFYSDELHNANFLEKPRESSKGYTCIFTQIAKVRKGISIALNENNIGCFGATDFMGFLPSNVDEFYIDFLVNFEKFKKDEEHVLEMVKDNPSLDRQGKYLILKRWDMLEETDNPQIVFFFAKPDVISAFHTLANYDYFTKDAVISPFGSGCESIISFAMKEALTNGDKCILGLFDPPARACIKKDLMTFSAPFNRFKTMIGNIDNSFLSTHLWDSLKKRLKD